MASPKVIFCVRCRISVGQTVGTCRCREEFLMNANNSRESSFYMNQFLEMITAFCGMNVPNPSETRLQRHHVSLEGENPDGFRSRNGERQQCSFQYFDNGVRIELNKSWDRYENLDQEAARSEDLNPIHGDVSTANGHYTLGVRLLADWDGSLEFSVLEIIGEGLDWSRILLAADSNTLHLDWHFYSFLHCGAMKCSYCDGIVVTDSGECRCQESSLINKEDETLMKNFEKSFLRVIEKCKEKRPMNPAEAVQEDVAHSYCGDGCLIYYKNGVGISFDYMPPIYMLMSSGFAHLFTETEPQQNIADRPPYLLHVRYSFSLQSLAEFGDVVIEIVGENLEWNVILEDVRNNVARLCWHFYHRQKVLPIWHVFLAPEEDENMEYVDDERDDDDGDAEEELELENDDAEEDLDLEYDDDDGGEDEVDVLRPASKAAIEALVSITVSSGGGPEFCSICQESMLASESTKQLPCEHIYHEVCILMWLSTKNTCPNCNYMLPTETD